MIAYVSVGKFHRRCVNVLSLHALNLELSFVNGLLVGF